MMKKAICLLSILAASFSGPVHADSDGLQSTIKKMHISNPEISPSPIPGLTSVMTPNGVIYITEDGRYVLQGPMYDVSGTKPVNISNQPLVAKLNALRNHVIVYKAAKEKHVITVFTDITCGYCHKLHQQIKGYNDLGITIRYLAFPRAGLASDTAKEMQAIWCAANGKKLLDSALKGDVFSPATASEACKDDIATHFKLAQQLGVTGTPAMVLEDGSLLPGYQPPEALAAILDHNEAPAKADPQ